MDDSMWQELLKAAVGPVLSAGLLLLVINQVARSVQRRHDDAETRQTLATDMTESANSLYFGLQRFWRAAASTPVSKRRSSVALKQVRDELDELYTAHRIRGTVIEQKLSIYYRNPLPAKYWRRTQSLLSTRYFLLFEIPSGTRDKILERNVGDGQSGLTKKELETPSTLLSEYRRSLPQSVQSLWEHRIDRAGKHLRKPTSQSEADTVTGS